jgi:hypothetical protein
MRCDRQPIDRSFLPDDRTQRHYFAAAHAGVFIER